MCWNRSGERQIYPVAYDVESKYLLDNGKTPQELANQTNVFCKAIVDAGYRPILYGNNQWLTNYVDVSQVPYDIWYARYGTTGEFQNRGRSGSLPRRVPWQASLAMSASRLLFL